MGWCCVGLGLSMVMLFYWLGYLGHSPELPSQIRARTVVGPALCSYYDRMTHLSTNHQGGLKTRDVLVSSWRVRLMPKATWRGIGADGWGSAFAGARVGA